GGDQQVFALSAGHDVGSLVDQAVELLAATGRECELAIGQLQLRRGEREEVPLAVGGLELAVDVEDASAVLYLVAGPTQPLNTGVVGHDAGDLVADGLRAVEGDLLAALRIDTGGEVLEDCPLGTRLANAGTRHLGREDDAALGAGLGAAATLFIA